jgi:hypothetical protein
MTGEGKLSPKFSNKCVIPEGPRSHQRDEGSGVQQHGPDTMQTPHFSQKRREMGHPAEEEVEGSGR